MTHQKRSTPFRAVIVAGLLFWQLTSSSGRAADTRGLVAVLPLDATNATITVADRAALEESIRTIAGESLRAAGYSVLTGENTLAVLSDNGVDATKPCGASCPLEAARELKATLFISGTMTTSEGDHIAFVRLFESGKGSQLASVQLEGATVKALRRQFEDKATELFAKAPGMQRSSREKASTNVQEGRIGGDADDFVVDGGSDVAVSFESDPAGATVLLDGELLCAKTPCKKSVSKGSHDVTVSMERYESARKSVQAAAGTTLRLSLTAKFGRLSVTSTPPGVGVTINGNASGETPLSNLELDPGGYEVLVGDRCFVPGGERVNLKAGDKRDIAVDLKQRQSAVKVSAEDGASNTVEADVKVDGESVGTSPGTFKVPVCSKTLALSGPGGLVWSQPLELQEKQVTVVAATLAKAREESPEIVVARSREQARSDAARWDSFRVGLGFTIGLFNFGSDGSGTLYALRVPFSIGSGVELELAGLTGALGTEPERESFHTFTKDLTAAQLSFGWRPFRLGDLAPKIAFGILGGTKDLVMNRENPTTHEWTREEWWRGFFAVTAALGAEYRVGQFAITSRAAITVQLTQDGKELVFPAVEVGVAYLF